MMSTTYYLAILFSFFWLDFIAT